MAFIPLVLSFSAQTLLTACVICYTPKGSLWRPAVAPIVLYAAYQTWLALDFFNNNQLINPMTAGFVAGFGLHHLNLLWASPLDLDDIQRDMGANTNSVYKNTMPTTGPFRRALYILTTLRGIDTSYEVRNIKHGSESSESRTRFLLHTLVITAAKYLVLDLMTCQPPSPENTHRMFGEGKEYLLFRPDGLPPPTMQDILTNLGVTLLGWGPIGSWFIEVHYRILSVVSVGLGVSRPHQWPPLFGSITEAHTLRRFWATFWHQLFRWPMQGLSSFLCRDFLRLPRPSLAERYLKITLIFAISSCLHLAIDGRAGIMLPQTGTLSTTARKCASIELDESCRVYLDVDVFVTRGADV
ncbi:membrane bound O-acyl transferase family-domain-containing protein [Aspergillus floccosus]